VSIATSTAQTIGDLLEDLGDIPPHRVRLQPAPGTATEEDVIAIEARENRLCELVDGVLVEKVMAYYESRVAGLIFRYLDEYLEEHDEGIVSGEAGMMRLAPRLVRIPDVSFISWKRLPHRRVPREPIAGLGPDLAVEVLSKGNTAREIDRKISEYFAAGAQLVWIVDPATRTVDVYTEPDDCTRLHERQSLKGGDLLPGFALPLRKLFARAECRREK
jgi:Uma2 family endonuclease